MGFGEAISACFSRYADFSGRARRSEYWWFYLFLVLLSIPFSIIDALTEFPIAGLLYSLATIVPTLSAGARRLHDTNRSGWWQAVPLGLLILGGIVVALAFVAGGNPENPNLPLVIVGVIGFLAGLIALIVLIVWLATDTVPQTNRFGPPAK